MNENIRNRAQYYVFGVVQNEVIKPSLSVTSITGSPRSHTITSLKVDDRGYEQVES